MDWTFSKKGEQMFKNILLSFDGSDHAINAAKLAAQQAMEQEHPFLWVVCVVENPSELFQEPFQSQNIQTQLAKGEVLINTAAKIIGNNIAIRQEILLGDVAEGIISVSESRGVDLIIMGTRGLGPVTELLMGSKTQKVITLAKCPVLVTK
jgi:nucleotide-binding universal stress UspA family protein